MARRDELEKMRKALIGDGSRHYVVLHGFGGIGKTQLSVAYAMRHKDDYSAVFWLNIKDDDSVKSSFVRVARQILRDHPSANQLSSIHLTNDIDAVVDAVKVWLSLLHNTRWLLIFDNYDHPKLPGVTDSEAVDIRSYLPEAHQGSVIITTRSAEVDMGLCLPIKKLDDVQDSLSILASSSQRRDLFEGKLLLYEGCKSDQRQIPTPRDLRRNLTGYRLHWRQPEPISAKRRQSAVRTIFVTMRTHGLNFRERVLG